MADHTIEAGLSGDVDLTALLQQDFVVSSSLSGDVDLTASLQQDFVVQASLLGGADLTATDSTSVPIEASLSGGVDLTGDISGDAPTAVTMSGSATFIARPYTPPGQLPAEAPTGPGSVAAGFAIAYANNVPAPFRAESTWGTIRYFPVLPRSVALLTGVGTHRLRQIPYRQGALKADIITGVAGGPLIVLFNDIYGYQTTIALDGSSRPSLILRDAKSVIVAQADPWGAAIAPGTYVSILLSWNATTGIVTFSVNGQEAPAWAAYPTTPWTALRATQINVLPGTFQVQQVQVAL